jgi:hypothetical protein
MPIAVAQLGHLDRLPITEERREFMFEVVFVSSSVLGRRERMGVEPTTPRRAQRHRF